jgi:hypothetical protein
MARGYLAVESARLGAAQNIAPSGSSVASTAFGAQTHQIRICASAAVQYRVGDGTPTAETTDTLLPANWVEYVTVTPGQRLAAIGTATVSITEITG